MTVIIHIEKIVLDGVALSTAQQVELQRDLTAGLVRLVADGFDPGSVDTRTGNVNLGLQVAGAICSAMPGDIKSRAKAIQPNDGADAFDSGREALR